MFMLQVKEKIQILDLVGNFRGGIYETGIAWRYGYPKVILLKIYRVSYDAII